MSAAPRRVTSLCVFCGSARGARPGYAEAAVALADEMARRGMRLVYGGGNIGLMGVVADAALARGVHVTGVIPEALAGLELAHAGVDDLRIVASMHERKATMASLADGFVALPGGIGTFEEWFEVLTWSQLGIHAKPCALLDVEGYYGDLLSLLDRAVREGFLRPAHLGRVLVARDPGSLLDAMEGWSAPGQEPLLDASET